MALKAILTVNISDDPITLPDGTSRPRPVVLAQAFGHRFGYQEFVEDTDEESPTFGELVIPNPESLGAFAKRMHRNVLRTLMLSYLTYLAQKQEQDMNKDPGIDVT